MGNFKKMVRERMAKTGESWQTAQRHVRNRVKPKDHKDKLVEEALEWLSNEPTEVLREILKMGKAGQGFKRGKYAEASAELLPHIERMIEEREHG